MSYPGSILVLLFFSALLAGCREKDVDLSTSRYLLPEFQHRSANLSGIKLVSAGFKPAVRLEKRNSQWWVVERSWPADPEKVQSLLEAMGDARLEEAKTRQANRYHFLGLEDIKDPDAQGAEVRLQFPNQERVFILGSMDSSSQKSYVRIPGDPQTWRLDRALMPSRNPDDWLHREIIDVPLAKISHLLIKPDNSTAFRLIRDADHFVVPEGASHDVRFKANGDELAAALQALAFEELRLSSASRKPERELEFHGVDGLVVELLAWREAARLWVQLNTRVDEQSARVFFSAKDPEEARIDLQIMALKQASADWNQRFHARQFLLPNETAAKLLYGRQQLPSKP